MDNAEKLHEMGQGKGQIASNKFVNKGTPEGPLLTRAELENAEVSTSATSKLRDVLSRD